MDISYNLPTPHPRRRPTQSEIASYKAIINKLACQIKALNGEVDRLELLRREKDNLASYIAPLRHLPPEIIALITHLCIESGVNLQTMMMVCGTIRDTISGMSVLWSKVTINPDHPYGYNLSNGASCRRTEQLKLILQRAGSTPLELSLEGTPDQEMLRSILSCNPMVWSLNIGHVHHSELANWLSDLNMSALRRLRFCGTKEENMKKIMGLALKSTSEQMALEVSSTYFAGGTGFLDHELLQHVSALSIERLMTKRTQYSKLAFPRIQRLKIHADSFPKIDLDGVRNLHFAYSAWHGDLNIPPLSSHLTELHVENVGRECKLPFLISDQPQNLPSLVTLRLDKINISGLLEKHFKIPKLKYLVMNSVSFYSGKDPEFHRAHAAFSQGFPELEKIEFLNTLMDEDFPSTVRLYPRLHTLIMPDRSMPELAIPFIQCLEDVESFPSLSRLDIPGTRYLYPGGMPYAEFVQQCTVNRPRLNIFVH